MSSPLTPEIMDNFVRRFNPSYNFDLALTYSQICSLENIAQDIAWCQALIETENFTRTLNINRFNPGGIIAVGSSNLHVFSSWNNGITAHVQHLLRYGTTRTHFLPLVNPRWSLVTAGIAPKVDDLQNRYSNQLGYSIAIKNKMLNLYKFAGFNNPVFIN